MFAMIYDVVCNEGRLKRVTNETVFFPRPVRVSVKGRMAFGFLKKLPALS